MQYSLQLSKQVDSCNQFASPSSSKASDILQLEINYKETTNSNRDAEEYKVKYIVLSNSETKSSVEEKPAKYKNGVDHDKERDKFSEPVVTLYAVDEVNFNKSKNWPVGAGMFNIGNTCYLNSTLQALFHIPALVNWLLTDPHHNSPCDQNEGSTDCLTCAVARTLQHSHKSPVIKPNFIFNKLQQICKTLKLGAQEDAHEFLRFLLDGMEQAYLARHESMDLDNLSKQTTPINQIFGGYLRSEVTCLDCYHCSVTYQHFQDLLLDVAQASTLEEAISSYFSREHLESKDYKCGACKQRVFATKQFSIKKPPKVLCIQLKRFSVTGSKISRYIRFKTQINLTPYIHQPFVNKKEFIYKLTSIITHVGSSANSGHYTAVAQASSGKYYSFDDVYVRQIGLNNLLNTNPYIMIYEMSQESSNKPPMIKVNEINRNPLCGQKDIKYFNGNKFKGNDKIKISPSNQAILKKRPFREDDYNKHLENKKLKRKATHFDDSNINYQSHKFSEKKSLPYYESDKFFKKGQKQFNNSRNYCYS